MGAFICTNDDCKTDEFNVHRFILRRHPNLAKCPDCGRKGTLSKTGRKIRLSASAMTNMDRYPEATEGITKNLNRKIKEIDEETK